MRSSLRVFSKPFQLAHNIARKQWCGRRSFSRILTTKTKTSGRTSGHYRRFHSSTWNLDSNTPAAELENALDEQDALDQLARTASPGSLTACPGCGALAQTVEAGEPGYYSLKRKTVGSYVRRHRVDAESASNVAAEAIDRADADLVQSLGLDKIRDDMNTKDNGELPLCDRCHQLIHHHVGVPIHHPSMESIADTIAESPHKYNHIYHVIDAADFPMSLVKNIDTILSADGLRSRNRRAKHTKYRHGKVTELSFVITRADLLAPKKEQVDSMMPYLLEVLRDALGASAKEVRLGNVCCVSAKRGWWTKELKADVWKRGGGGWMVGKVNVGKSNLFEVIFPKGKTEDINFDIVRRDARRSKQTSSSHNTEQVNAERVLEEPILNDEDSLLPPARPETPYPVMPTISSLPGTTASPIRIPFGGGKGELIDLPGLARSDIDQNLRPEHRDSLVMKARITPEQYVIKPGQSLLLGGLVRITPVTDDLVIMAYPFTPLPPHLTSTEKALRIQSGDKDIGSKSVMSTGDTKTSISSAGHFELKWDVTKQRAGPLTTSSAAAMKVKELPFRVLSADILIESVGWVELVAQVRKRRPDCGGTSDEIEPGSEGRDTMPDEEQKSYPRVEVFSPEGRFISVRRPMNAWLLGGQQKRSSQEKGRPRKSMAAERRSRRSPST